MSDQLRSNPALAPLIWIVSIVEAAVRPSRRETTTPANAAAEQTGYAAARTVVGVGPAIPDMEPENPEEDLMLRAQAHIDDSLSTYAACRMAGLDVDALDWLSHLEGVIEEEFEDSYGTELLEQSWVPGWLFERAMPLLVEDSSPPSVAIREGEFALHVRSWVSEVANIGYCGAAEKAGGKLAGKLLGKLSPGEAVLNALGLTDEMKARLESEQERTTNCRLADELHCARRQLRLAVTERLCWLLRVAEFNDEGTGEGDGPSGATANSPTPGL